MKKTFIAFGEFILRFTSIGYLLFSQCDEFSTTFGKGRANVAVSLANYGISVGFVNRNSANEIDRAWMKIFCKHVKKHSK